ncbi:cell division protein PerM [Pseudonocardia phyllosphaerae]|uniref:cell division protein PerM n=1 Tax=Pseudonocardia phyllosphaerae TaxID=3390502 RepID=UPI0039792D1C
MSSSPSGAGRGRSTSRTRSSSARTSPARSPSARSSSARSSSPEPARTATAVRERPAPEYEIQVPDRGHGLDRIRILLVAALGAVLVGYTVLVPLGAVLAATGGASTGFDGALATAVPLWLAAYQIPIAVGGHELGVLPLLSTLLVVGVTAFASSWAVRRLGGRARVDAGAVVATQAGAAAALAVLAGALLPREMAVTAPWASLVGPGLLGGLGAAAGVLRACEPPVAWRRLRASGYGAVASGALATLRVGAIGLLLAGALTLLLGLALGAGAVTATAQALGPGTGAGFGVLLLGVGYLPNAVVGALSWALGAGISTGVTTSSPLVAEPGPLPPFPMAAALPVTTVPPAAPLILLLPVAVGVLAGLACRRALPASCPTTERLAAPAVGAVALAVAASLLAALAGGSLAGGPYDPVSFHGGAVLGLVLLLVGSPAVLACAGAELARHVPAGSRESRGPAARTRDARPARERHARTTRRVAAPAGAPAPEPADTESHDTESHDTESHHAEPSAGAHDEVPAEPAPKRPATVAELVAQREAERAAAEQGADEHTHEDGSHEDGTHEDGTHDDGEPRRES